MPAGTTIGSHRLHQHREQAEAIASEHVGEDAITIKLTCSPGSCS